MLFCMLAVFRLQHAACAKHTRVDCINFQLVLHLLSCLLRQPSRRFSDAVGRPNILADKDPAQALVCTTFMPACTRAQPSFSPGVQ